MDAVSAAYDRWSASYDTDRNATRDLDALMLRQSGLPVQDADVLEVGCGTGKNTEWLATQAHALIAMDFSPGMLAHARERVRGDQVRFVQHDLRDPWPVPTASMDVVIGNLVLEHLEHLAPIFAEGARVLRPGGTLYLCELHPFRQFRGGQAHFTDAVSGTVVQVPAYTHTISEFVNSGIAAGLTLRHLGEWLEPDAAPGQPARLLAMRWERAVGSRE